MTEITNPVDIREGRTPLGMAITGLALVAALLAVAGSLYLSIGMELKACPLCFYQRTFAMAAVAVLGLGMLLPGVRVSVLHVLALPAAVGGLAIAVWHCYLEGSGRLECPAGVFALGSAPQQSLAIYVILLGLLIAGLIADSGRRGADLAIGAGAIVLGILFAVGGIRSSPKTPVPDYTVPVDQDGCRKPK
jgi:disulfide bond formation protein DsbB